MNQSPIPFPADLTAEGYSGRYVERSTSRVFTHKRFPDRARPHILFTIDHFEGQPMMHELTDEEFQRLFEKD